LARERLGWVVIVVGWTSYVIALAVPAIEFSAPGLDMGSWHETKFGVVCLVDTFNVANWLFAPLLALYLGGNLIMLASLFVVPCWPPARTTWGALLLVCFALSLSVPVCAQEVKGTLVGAYFWMGSFLFAGLGCLLLPRTADGKRWKNGSDQIPI
jgi:hypothetical protein